MNGNKKFLALAVLCAVASVGFVLPASAEETMQHDLEKSSSKQTKTLCRGDMSKQKATSVF